MRSKLEAFGGAEGVCGGVELEGGTTVGGRSREVSEGVVLGAACERVSEYLGVVVARAHEVPIGVAVVVGERTDAEGQASVVVGESVDDLGDAPVVVSIEAVGASNHQVAVVDGFDNLERELEVAGERSAVLSGGSKRGAGVGSTGVGESREEWFVAKHPRGSTLNTLACVDPFEVGEAFSLAGGKDSDATSGDGLLLRVKSNASEVVGVDRLALQLNVNISTERHSESSVEGGGSSNGAVRSAAGLGAQGEGSLQVGLESDVGSSNHVDGHLHSGKEVDLKGRCHLSGDGRDDSAVLEGLRVDPLDVGVALIVGDAEVDGALSIDRSSDGGLALQVDGVASGDGDVEVHGERNGSYDEGHLGSLKLEEGFGV